MTANRETLSDLKGRELVGRYGGGNVCAFVRGATCVTELSASKQRPRHSGRS